MKKLFLIKNIILLILLLIFDVYYMLKGGLFFKSIASCFFVITGIVNLVYCVKHRAKLKYPIWMIVALVFAMMGDILLLINFYLGAAAFAMGHIFYFVAYCMLRKINSKDLIYGLGIGVISLVLLWTIPFLEFESSLMFSVCCSYAMIISFMVGKAISNCLVERTKLNQMIVLGSILFYISDFMLLLNVFGDVPGTSHLCLITYYPAQFILAFSLFVYGNLGRLRLNKSMV